MKHAHSDFNTLGPLFDKPLPQIPNGSDSGQQLKEKGIREVSEHNDNWMEQAITESRLWVKHTLEDDFTGEDIRSWCEKTGLQPKHPNAWGALISTLVKRGIIVPTGEYRQPKDKSSHARKIQVYTAPSQS